MSDSPFAKLQNLNIVKNNDIEDLTRPTPDDEINYNHPSDGAMTTDAIQVIASPDIKPYVPNKNIIPASDVLSAYVAEMADKMILEKNPEAFIMSRMIHLDSIGELVKKNAHLNGCILSIAETAKITVRQHTISNGVGRAIDVPVTREQNYDDNTLAYIAACLSAVLKKNEDDIKQKTDEIAKLTASLNSANQTISTLRNEQNSIKKVEFQPFTDKPYVIYNAAQATFIGFDRELKRFVAVDKLEKAKRWETHTTTVADLFKMLNKNRIEFIQHYRIRRLRSSGEEHEMFAPETVQALAEARRSLGGH